MALFGLKKNTQTADAPATGQVKADRPVPAAEQTTEPATIKATKNPATHEPVHPLAYKSLIHPLITEKANLLTAYNQYSFMVDHRANKSVIKQAIQEVYHVNPVRINISRQSGKQVRTGKNTTGHLKNWKKAIVTLPAGTKIDVYES